MKTVSVATLAALVLITASTAYRASAQGSGWTTLFDGSSLDGWVASGDANWNLVDGVVQADSGGGHLVSEESYSDFVLTLDFWVDDPANSGVFIRCPDRDNIGAASCYEVNIYDQRADQTYRTGGIVDFAAPASQIDAGGQWNSYEIRADGSHLVVTLNGTVTVDIEDSTYAEGVFTLQYGSGIVKFRNVRIMPL